MGNFIEYIHQNGTQNSGDGGYISPIPPRSATANTRMITKSLTKVLSGVINQNLQEFCNFFR